MNLNNSLTIFRKYLLFCSKGKIKLFSIVSAPLILRERIRESRKAVRKTADVFLFKSYVLKMSLKGIASSTSFVKHCHTAKVHLNMSNQPAA